MHTVATNIRFPKDDYEELRLLAFQNKTSIASLVNAAVKEYKFKRLAVSRKSRLSLFDTISKSRLKSAVSTVKLAKEGRRCE